MSEENKWIIFDERHAAGRNDPSRRKVRAAVIGTRDDAERVRQEQLAIANRKRAKRGKPALPEEILSAREEKR